MGIVTDIENFLKRKNETDEPAVKEETVKSLGDAADDAASMLPFDDEGENKEETEFVPSVSGEDTSDIDETTAPDSEAPLPFEDEGEKKNEAEFLPGEDEEPAKHESVEKEKSSEKKGVWKSKAVERAIIVGLAGLCLYSSRDNLKDAWDYFSGGKTMEGTATPGTGDNLDTGSGQKTTSSGSEDGAEKKKEAIELTVDNIDSMKLEPGKTYKATGNFDGFRKEIEFTMGDKFEADQLSVNALKGYNTEVDENNERSKKNGVSFGEYQYDRSTDLSSMSEQELKNLMHDSFDDSLDRYASGEESVAAAFYAMEKGYQWGDVKVDTIQKANDLLNNGMLKDPEINYDVTCFVVKNKVKDAMEHDIQMVFYGPDEEYQSYFATKQPQTGDGIYYSKCNDTHTGDKGILGYSVDGERPTSLACLQPIETGTDPTAISIDEAELIHTSGSEGDYFVSAGSEDDATGQEGDVVVVSGYEPDSRTAGTELDGKTGNTHADPTIDHRGVTEIGQNFIYRPPEESSDSKPVETDTVYDEDNNSTHDPDRESQEVGGQVEDEPQEQENPAEGSESGEDEHHTDEELVQIDFNE